MRQPATPHVRYGLALAAAALIVAFSVVSGEESAARRRVSVDLGIRSADVRDGSVKETSADGSAPTEFVATSEWTEIKPGQSIPRGLHVRMNLETGVKEAKLLTPDAAESVDAPAVESSSATKDSPSSSVMLSPSATEQPLLEEPPEPPSPFSFRHAELERALKDIATSGDEPGAAGERKKITVDEAYLDSVRKKFRSIDEIKEEFEAANLNVKIDAEIINDLLKEFRDPAVSENRLLTILEDLEYYLHQIDNAVYFSGIGGIAELLDLMNRTLDHHTNTISNASLLSSIAQALGAAWHSNPKVQVIAFKQGATLLLLRTLQTTHGVTVADGVAGSSSATESALSSALYALAALLRRFPAAQHSFVDHGGLSTLMSLSKRGEHVSSTGRLEVKVVALIDDLLTEERSMSEQIVDGRLPVSLRLLDVGWCECVNKLLASVAEHMHREKVLLAVKSSLSTCRDRFNTLDVGSLLRRLIVEYEELVSQEPHDVSDGESYYGTLLEMVRNVARELTDSAAVHSPSTVAKEEL